MSRTKVKSQKSKVKNWENGFSLIEMIVVISILGVVMVIASSFLLVSLMASSKAEITKEVRQSGNQALSVIEGMILNSLDVGCTIGTTGGSGIWVKGIDNNLSTVVFDETYHTIASISANKTYSLTSTNVSVTNGSFTCGIKNPGQPTKIGVSFSVGIGGVSSRPSEKAALDFQTEVVTRNYQ